MQEGSFNLEAQGDTPIGNGNSDVVHIEDGDDSVIPTGIPPTIVEESATASQAGSMAESEGTVTSEETRRETLNLLPGGNIYCAACDQNLNGTEQYEQHRNLKGHRGKIRVWRRRRREESE